MRIGQDKSAVTACIGELSGELEPLNSKLDIGNFEIASRPVSKSSVTINFLSDFLSRIDEKKQHSVTGEAFHGGSTWRRYWSAPQ
jgi:hypothetical protein